MIGTYTDEPRLAYDPSLVDKQADEFTSDATSLRHMAIYFGMEIHFDPLQRVIAHMTGGLSTHHDLSRAGIVPTIEALFRTVLEVIYGI